jgi:hypothetical protein
LGPSLGDFKRKALHPVAFGGADVSPKRPLLIRLWLHVKAKADLTLKII